MTPRAGEIAAAAKTLVGAPFRHHGRNPRREGVDCVGLSLAAYRMCGIVCRDSLDYPPKPKTDILARMLRRNLGPPRHTIQDGDQLVFWIEDQGVPQHTGTAVFANGVLGMVHILQGRTAVYLPRLTRFWRMRQLATYGLRG